MRRLSRKSGWFYLDERTHQSVKLMNGYENGDDATHAYLASVRTD